MNESWLKNESDWYVFPMLLYNRKNILNLSAVVIHYDELVANLLVFKCSLIACQCVLEFRRFVVNRNDDGEVEIAAFTFFQEHLFHARALWMCGLDYPSVMMVVSV
jgi:hypothetical protein